MPVSLTMTLAESLLYSGLSASFTIFCWLVRFAWVSRERVAADCTEAIAFRTLVQKRWRKKKRVVRPADDEAAAAPDDELGQEVKDVPFSICGNVMKGVGER